MRAFGALVAALLVAGNSTPALAGEAIFEFEQLAGIAVPGTVLRGIPGGGLPWIIDRGEARLEADGTFRVEVEGLVLAAGPNAGINPAPLFRATLSCLGADGVTVVNVSTDPFPATPEGDGRVEQVVFLPETCLAPVVLVGSPARWFAVSGF